MDHLILEDWELGGRAEREAVNGHGSSLRLYKMFFLQVDNFIDSS